MRIPLQGSAVIGVDLDLTLIDTRAATAYALSEVNRRCGASIDVTAMIGRLGPPIRQELGRWVAATDLDVAVAVFRESFRGGGVEKLTLMPGAADLCAAALRNGGGLVVITSRIPLIATACLTAVGIEASVVVGGVTGIEKAGPMKEHGVAAYIGDHPLDMQGAVEAGVPAVGVTTGNHSADELKASGAVWTVESLREVAAKIQTGPTAD